MLYGTSIVIEKKSFMMHYEKGVFSIKSHPGSNLTLSRHLGTTIEDIGISTEVRDLFQNFELFNKSSTSKVNLAETINNVYEKEQITRVKRGSVYLITDGQYVKIGGTTNNLLKRMKELQTGNPRKLKVLGEYGTDYLNQTERLIQYLFKDNQVLNEWFELSEKEIKSILEEKLSFRPNDTHKQLSLISMVSIMDTQYNLLREEYEVKYKQLIRKHNKLVNINIRMIDKIETHKSNNKLMLEYFKRNRVDDIQNSHSSFSKELKEIEQLSEYVMFMEKERFNYLEDNSIYYDDDNFIYKHNKSNMEVL